MKNYTKIDLRLEYLFDSGEYHNGANHYTSNLNDDKYFTKEYQNYLEEKVCNLQKNLNIKNKL